MTENPPDDQRQRVKKIWTRIGWTIGILVFGLSILLHVLGFRPGSG